MRHKWIWLLVGWLMVVGMVGCGQAVPPDTPGGEAVVATATVEPANAPEAQPSPGIGPSEETPPSAIGTPAPLQAVVPISLTRGAQEETVTAIPTIPTPSNPALQELVMQAKEDLARRLVIEVEQIELLEAKAVVWPDAGLGCPRPGMMYAQVITPGFRLVLEAEGRTYEYHTDGGQNAVLCEEESMTDMPTVPSPVEPGLERLVDMAKADLARRLSISVDQIELIEAKQVDWTNSSMGCPEPGGQYLQVLQVGELIRLRANDRVYEYHSGKNRPPFLCEPTK